MFRMFELATTKKVNQNIMSYQDDFQKRSRINRPRNEKANLRFFEVASKSGAHDDKVGKHAKRAVQSKLSKSEIERALNEDDFGDDDY